MMSLVFKEISQKKVQVDQYQPTNQKTKHKTTQEDSSAFSADCGNSNNPSTSVLQTPLNLQSSSLLPYPSQGNRMGARPSYPKKRSD